MRNLRSIANGNHDSGGGGAACGQCAIRLSGICGVLLRLPPHEDESPCEDVGWQSHQRIQAHKNIESAGERSDRVYAICEGWAFLFAQLPDGRKQVLSILIPGDIITPTRPFDEEVRFSAQALTDVRCCGFARSIIRARLKTDLVLLDAWGDLLAAERQQNLHLVVDLGCRSADERIARLILDLKMRLERRGMAVGNGASFPVSQRVIAAATGLTPEHVSRVISRFRSAGLMETANGTLRIIDLVGLRRIGALKL